MKKNVPVMPVATKTYILDLNNGDMRKVTVPSSWKLTFGPTIPYAGKGMASVASGGTALRFYEGAKENLRCVFTDVKAFRDSDVEISERRTSVQRKVVQKEAPEGMRNVEVEARVTEWINPDNAVVDGEPQNNKFLAMLNVPHLSE